MTNSARHFKDIEELHLDLTIETAADALFVALALHDEFGTEPYVAAWVGGADGEAIDVVAVVGDVPLEAAHLVHYAAVTSCVHHGARVVLFRSGRPDDDLSDLAADFFARREQIEHIGGTLLDEIVVDSDAVRSMAVTTFSDPPGWDDVELGDPNGAVDRFGDEEGR